MQGHVGYPHLADNPIPRLLDILTLLKTRRLDAGNVHFEPSNLEITTVDVGNPANNVIPASAKAVLNIRRSEEHTSELQSLMRISYAVFCLKKKKKTLHTTYNNT